MGKMSTLGWIALILVVVGGLNWGLVAINSSYNVVDSIFGVGSSLARIVYGLVGLSALYMLWMAVSGKSNS